MMPVDRKAASAARWFKWSIVIGWAVVYLHCLAQAGWRMDAFGGGFLMYGFPGIDVMNRHGAAIPVLVHQGDWHRLLLDVLINVTLIGFLFTVWVWSSLGGMLVSLAGVSRTWLVFALGGAAGALAHAYQHPELPFAGAGPTGAIMAALGAIGTWGFTNTGPAATACRQRFFGYLIAIIVLTVVFALVMGQNVIRMGTFELWAMLGSLVLGSLLMFAFGVRRVPDAAGVVVRGAAVLVLLTFVYAVVVQAPRAFAGSAEMDRARDYITKITDVERAAWNVRRAHEKTGRSRQAQLDGTLSQRTALEDALREVRQLDWLDKFAGRERLLAYLDTFEGFVRLDYGLISIQIARMKQAWDAYRSEEQDFLNESGIRFRERNVWTSEFEK